MNGRAKEMTAVEQRARKRGTQFWRMLYFNLADEVEQSLGKVLGYPWYKDDQKNFPGATEAEGVCVGDHVPESMLSEAVTKLTSNSAGSAERASEVGNSVEVSAAPPIEPSVQPALAAARETNRELNRRVGELTKALNGTTDRKVWHGYYRAALSLFGMEEKRRIQAEQRLSAMRAEWKDATKELPNHGRLVLAFAFPNIMGLSYRQSNLWLSVDPEVDRQFAGNSQLVSHWRELPEPPIRSLSSEIATKEK